MESDAAYFAGRATEERAAALLAQNSKARQAHLDLAARYEELASAITARERYLGIAPRAD